MQNGRRRILKDRSAGLHFAAPFWRGERAEHIVEQRVIANTADKEAKRLARAAARANRQPHPTEGATPAAPVANTELRRLERALRRRKTLAARQRLEQRIQQLREDLGA